MPKMITSNNATVFISILLLTVLSINTSEAQISTACTNSLLRSFTPCLNFLTNSTNGGGSRSPSPGCCSALGSLISSSTNCACLILTGNVPFNLPINQQLAITLPRLCNSQSVPLQCKASSSPLPSPGPKASAPSLPPLSPSGETGPDSGPPATSPASDELPTSPTTGNEGQRPLLQLPNSAIEISTPSSPTLVAALALAALLFN